MTTTYDNEAAVELVRSFANTVDVDDRTDELATVDGLEGWIRGQGWPLTGTVTDDDLRLARAVREALRKELGAHHGGGHDHAALRELDRLATDLPLRATFGGDELPRLVPHGDGGGDGRGALATVIASVVSLAQGDAWQRLKICPADDCLWVFYDESRNRSRRWCSMNECGNRSKVRTYRDRHTT